MIGYVMHKHDMLYNIDYLIINMINNTWDKIDMIYGAQWHKTNKELQGLWKDVYVNMI